MRCTAIVEREKRLKELLDEKKKVHLRIPETLLRGEEEAGTNRVNLLDVEGAFVLENVLNEAECVDLVKQCEEQMAFRPLEHEFETEERNNERCITISEDLARCLYQRVWSHFRPDDVLFVKPVGFGNEGAWRPTRLNECLKISRYREGTHFAPHMDGPWVPRDDESSIYTIVFYLSTSAPGAGGVTQFFSEENEGQVLGSVVPKSGSCVCFFHDTLHGSTPVLDGTKYVLRTEIMFARVNRGDIPERLLNAYEDLPSYKRMVKVYAESEEAFWRGNVEQFGKLYKEAIAIQRAASLRPSEAQRFGRSRLPFPTDVCVIIFSYLDLQTLLMGVSLASKQFRELSFDGRIWKRLFKYYFTDMAFSVHDPLVPEFFRRMKSLEKGNQNRRGLEAKREIEEAMCLFTDTGGELEQEDDSSLTPMQRELLAKRKIIRRKRDEHPSVSTVYFDMFRRRCNFARSFSPALVIDLCSPELYIGVQRDLGDGVNDSIHQIPNKYCKKEYGDYHYRTVHTYFGRECNDKSGVLPIKDPTTGIPGASYVLGECIMRNSPAEFNIDCALFIEPPHGWGRLTKARLENVISPKKPHGFVSLVTLLKSHYGWDEGTCIVGRHLGSLWIHSHYDGTLAFAHQPIVVAVAIAKSQPKRVIFAGDIWGPQVEQELLQHCAKDVLVVNQEKSLEARLEVPSRAALRLLRSIFFTVPKEVHSPPQKELHEPVAVAATRAVAASRASPKRREMATIASDSNTAGKCPGCLRWLVQGKCATKGCTNKHY